MSINPEWLNKLNDAVTTIINNYEKMEIEYQALLIDKEQWVEAREVHDKMILERNLLIDELRNLNIKQIKQIEQLMTQNKLQEENINKLLSKPAKKWWEFWK